MRVMETPACHCGDAECMHLAFDYPWCRPCEEHHRPPECDVDEQGRALSSCGCTWERIEKDPLDHRPGCVYTEDDSASLQTCSNCGVRWGPGEWHPNPCRARVVGKAS